MKSIFCVWLLLLSSLGHAVQVSNLYSSVVQLPGSLEGQALLNRAFNQAIDDILIRVSGQPAQLSEQILNKAHRSAAGWVAQHSIQGAGGDKDVSVTFYKASVDQFLFDQGLPVWGSNRPSILVWLIEERDGARTMYGANQPSTLLSGLFDGAKRHGLPVYAPLVDSIDQNVLDGSALWGFFEEDILKASARYQTDVVLAVRISEYHGKSVVDSMLMSPNQPSRMVSVTSDTKHEAMQEVLLRLSAILSDRYASVRLASPNEMLVEIGGVSDYQAMSSLKKYLSSIGVVKAWQLNRIVDGQVAFDVSLNGTQEKFRNSVALNSVLAFQPVSPLDPDANRVVKYQYMGKGNN